jgi:RES domain-containing protein
VALEKSILDRLQSITPEPWTGTVYRHLLGSRDPLLPNTRGARWNPPGVDALYASLERATAVAEGDYLIASQPVPLAVERRIHRIRISLKSVIRLTDAILLRGFQIDEAALSSTDHQACQKIGHAVAWLEHDGLMVPSARASGVNLVVFVNNAESEPETLDFEILRSGA